MFTHLAALQYRNMRKPFRRSFAALAADFGANWHPTTVKAHAAILVDLGWVELIVAERVKPSWNVLNPCYPLKSARFERADSPEPGHSQTAQIGRDLRGLTGAVPNFCSERGILGVDTVHESCGRGESGKLEDAEFRAVERCRSCGEPLDDHDLSDVCLSCWEAETG